MVTLSPFPYENLPNSPSLLSTTPDNLLLGVSLPPADAEADPRRLHSALLLHCMHQASGSTQLVRTQSAPYAHYLGSSTGTLPEADLRRCRHFCSLNLAASPSYSSHEPYTTPPTDHDFGTRPHGHCFYMLDTSLYLTLILRPHSRSIEHPPPMRQARTSASRSSLCTSRTPSPPLYCTPPTPHLPPLIFGLLHRFGYPPLPLLVLHSASSYSSTSALLKLDFLLSLARSYV
ncbi:hypothetical protein B0H13DRAFT_2345551 [Mycena leptocephala]|nr:hypothetical protein B0H13DRAFT_2345551 [Mycena leptocephala]